MVVAGWQSTKGIESLLIGDGAPHDLGGGVGRHHLGAYQDGLLRVGHATGDLGGLRGQEGGGEEERDDETEANHASIIHRPRLPPLRKRQ